MSDNKNRPGPPPDDFSKTTPNINLPDNSPQVDWDKTNYNIPRPMPSDEGWGKTVTNIKPINTDQQDFGKTMYPGAKDVPAAPEWGMTQANVNIPQSDFGGNADQHDFGGQQEAYGKTTPYFSLPEAERAKYQNLPPTPAEVAAQEEKEKKERGGIPGWVWAVAGLLVMFFFAVIVLVGVFLWIYKDPGFEATVKGAPPGSTVRVNGSPWGVTDGDGNIKLPLLKEGETKKIEIVHQLYECQPIDVRSQNGVVSPNPIIAKCQEKKVEPGEDCTNIGLGEEDKAERCYNLALDSLPDPFTPEDLVKALNILVINFASGSTEVPPARLAALQKGAKFIQKLQPGVVLEVGGHTDSVGNAASNQTLSEGRATAVKDTLVKFGVRPDTLQTRGYGPAKPKADNNTEQGKFHNRRIEYSVVRK